MKIMLPLTLNYPTEQTWTSTFMYIWHMLSITPFKIARHHLYLNFKVYAIIHIMYDICSLLSERSQEAREEI